MNKRILSTFCIVLLSTIFQVALGQTEQKNKFLDTIRLGVRYQVQEFHTLNQKLEEHCNCDEGAKLKERALQGIGVSLFEPIGKKWAVGADLMGTFGQVMRDDRSYRKHSFVQMRADAFYHLFDEKTKLRPYVTGGMQLAVNLWRGLFSVPLGAGLRYNLAKGGYLHLQTAYDAGMGNYLARNFVTNVGFHVPLYKRKESSLAGSDYYVASTTNSASAAWDEAKKKSAANANSIAASAYSSANLQANNSTSQVASTPAPKQLVRVIYFDTDKNFLNKAETQKVLAEVLAFMAENKGTKVYLSGHTDNILSEAYNMALSKSRVESTAAKLIKEGISLDRIEKAHYGESSPIASNRYESGRATNRRVEIVVR